MRPILLSLILPALLGAAPALSIVKPVISQKDGGAPMPPGFEHRPGETLYFSCRVAGYSQTPEEKVHVAYSVQAFDPNGVPLTDTSEVELPIMTLPGPVRAASAANASANALTPAAFESSITTEVQRPAPRRSSN